MSHFTSIQTQIRDLEALEAACTELGVELLRNTEARGFANTARHGELVVRLKGPYDIAATLKAKLGIDRPALKILGACNPALASRVLAAEPEIGALLPCNVVVRRGQDAAVTTIDAIDPQTMVQLSDNPVVKEIADDAGTRLRNTLTALNS